MEKKNEFEILRENEYLGKWRNIQRQAGNGTSLKDQGKWELRKSRNKVMNVKSK